MLHLTALSHLFAVLVAIGGPPTTPPPDPTACCLDDGTCILVNTYEECVDEHQGIWHGDWTSCDPNPCPQTGACCLPSGDCVEVLETACEEASGVFYAGLTCDEVVCEPTPTRDSSWGRIKSLYAE